MTHQRSRLQRVMKWVGLGLCTFVAAVWGTSGFRAMRWSGTNISVLLVSGVLQVDELMTTQVAVDSRGFRVYPGRVDSWWPPAGQRLPRRAMFASAVTRGGRTLSATMSVRITYLPLWLPLVALAVPTAMLWYRDRKPPKGHCQKCGYDLTGNESGRCPECGKAI